MCVNSRSYIFYGVINFFFFQFLECFSFPALSHQGIFQLASFSHILELKDTKTDSVLSVCASNFCNSH